MEKTVRHSAGGVLVTKWSSKPADHKITRVRNNQRRHREKVRCYIAQLESKLAEIQPELDQALATIERLTAELENARASAPVGRTGNAAYDREITETDRLKGPLSPLRQPSHLSPRQRGRCASGESVDVRVAYASLLGDASADATSCSDDPVRDTHMLLPLFGRSTTTETCRGYDKAVGDGEKECSHLQPPDPQESTTRCRDAYKIIAEQNYASLEVSTIHGWLQPGFRGAVAEGDGCRVDNKLLFALLDYITPL